MCKRHTHTPLSLQHYTYTAVQTYVTTQTETHTHTNVGHRLHKGPKRGTTGLGRATWNVSIIDLRYRIFALSL